MKELALHILDIAENSIRAGACRIHISLYLSEEQDLLRIRISDNGTGMNDNELKKVANPFFTSRSTRKVGLGVPLLRQHAEMTGGSLEIISEIGDGTEISAEFSASHPDLQPIGDIEGCWALLSAAHPFIDFVLEYKTGNGCYEISSKEAKDFLGLATLSDPLILNDLKGMIRNNIDELNFRPELID